MQQQVDFCSIGSTYELKMFAVLLNTNCILWSNQSKEGLTESVKLKQISILI